MKILVDAHIFDKNYQGSRTYIKGLYTEMVRIKKDWQFIFAGTDIQKLRKEFGSAPNIQYVALRFTNKYIRLLFELPYHIIKNKVDFSHFQYITPLWKVGKYIVTTHDILFEEDRFVKYFPVRYRKLNGFLFKRSARKATVLLTVSEYSKTKISEQYHIPRENIYVTPNGVSQNREAEKDTIIKQKYGCEKYLLYVSRVEPRKNHIALLKAFVNLRLYQKGYQVVFIGFRDIAHKELEAYIVAHSDLFNDKLHFFSDVPEKDLWTFYQNAAFFVYPSLAEGFGIPPLEAAVSKIPVICSSATAMKEFSFFKHHVDPNHQEAIEKSILKVMDGDTDDMEQIKKLVEQKYHWGRSARILINLLEQP